ncbi:hypothetical protein KDK95_11620 [Actinospica sp. MGRD01-02]|uniref:Uncharacterized protein n=1 Tax=Actinospica acidithermotolerans TaxID=2828514 RepID=A0A941EFX5_9ACTN|nr:hypothetical protein [Actinospica acidithermotolerans]MBR7826954.1 hypothetical protein [Actinospica acidithermotolerans]
MLTELHPAVAPPPDLVTASGFLSPQITRYWPLAVLGLALLVFAAPLVRSVGSLYDWARRADRAASAAAAARRPKAPRALRAGRPGLGTTEATTLAAVALASLAEGEDSPAPYAVLAGASQVEVLLPGADAGKPRAPWTATAANRWVAPTDELTADPADAALLVLGMQGEGWLVVDLDYCPGTIAVSGAGAADWIGTLGDTHGIQVTQQKPDSGCWTVRIGRNGLGAVEELGLPFDGRPLRDVNTAVAVVAPTEPISTPPAAPEEGLHELALSVSSRDADHDTDS